MKVLCPQCDRLGELEQFRLEGGQLVVTCIKCNAENRVSAQTASTPPANPESASPRAAPSPAPQRLSSAPGASNVVLLKNVNTAAVENAANSATNPFEVPAGLCPKCLAKRAEHAGSCPQCGLEFARFDAETVVPPQWLAEAWRTLLLQWGDENQHDKLRKKAVQAEVLPAIGRLYRLRLASMAQDPYAQRGRDEVLRLASVPVNVTSNQTETQTPRSRFLPIAALLVFLLILSVMVFRFIAAARSNS